MHADRICAGACCLDLALVRQRQPRNLVEPACRARRCETGRRQLLAVERRPVEEVRELRSVRRIVVRELIRPRDGLDVRLKDHSAGGW
jgi:hypothetical protein